ncbi:MAG TPA: zf-TFIIB domain-containing protein [Verrucomicrobiae bacterium]|nr:zf-TFIIB domain-containing protein [Verrucomicrobiae bacterium]
MHTDRKCPSCEKPMVEVPLMPPPDPLVLDACRSCQFVWFDASELEKIPAAPPQPRPEDEFRNLPPEAREMIALHKVQQMAAQARREETPASPQGSVWLEVLPAIVDLIT